MATYRLEFDNHGEPVLVEECNGTTATPIADWVERYLSGREPAPGQMPAKQHPRSCAETP